LKGRVKREEFLLLRGREIVRLFTSFLPFQGGGQEGDGVRLFENKV